MAENEEKKFNPEAPDAGKLYDKVKGFFASFPEDFDEFMKRQGMKSEGASDIKAPEAYITNLKGISDVGTAYHQFPIFKLNEWAGRDRGWYDMAMADGRNHANNLNALTVSRIASANLAQSVGDLGLVAMFMEWFNRLVNIDEPSAWLTRMFRTENYGDSILALAIMFIAKASGITLDEPTFTAVYEMFQEAKAKK